VTDAVMTRQKPQVATTAELAAAREARGMSQVDISQRTKLQIRQVSALDEGNWDALPGRSFVRGALRSYARLIEVDVTPLLDSIGDVAEPVPVPVRRPRDASISRSAATRPAGTGGMARIAWVVAGLIGAAALVFYFGPDQETSRSPSRPGASPSASSSTSPSAASSGSPSGTTTGGESASRQSQGASGVSSAPAGAGARDVPGVQAGVSGQMGTLAQGSAAGDPSAAPPVVAAAGANGAAGADAAAATPESGGLMQFRAREDSWIEVRQADGTALHNGLLKAGSSLELKGNPPFRLVLGNASRLELSYDGKLQDLVPYTRSNDVARLRLP
jgi:cytoskeleton protein RodZ